MSVTYRIDRDHRLVLLTASGPTSRQDIADMQARLRADPAFSADFHQMFDFRNATPTDIKSGDVGSLLESAPFSDTVRRAYVVAPGVGYGMGRMAAAIADFKRLSLRVFLDPEEARAWLLAPPDQTTETP